VLRANPLKSWRNWKKILQPGTKAVDRKVVLLESCKLELIVWCPTLTPRVTYRSNLPLVLSIRAAGRCPLAYWPQSNLAHIKQPSALLTDMSSMTEWTYKSLIKPIAPISNLANIVAQESSRTCQFCAAIVPDREKCVNGLIKINCQRIDLYPDFPELKASANAGCGLCKCIRKTIKAKWAVRPMEEWGVGPLREKEGLWEELFAAPWDCKVKIHNISFSLKKSSDNSSAPLDAMASENQDDYCGMVVFFGFEFGPATLPTSPDGKSLYGEIGQIVGFKVFDSQGEPINSRRCSYTHQTAEDINSINTRYQRRLPSLSSLSEPNLRLVSSWIRECKDSHAKCRLDTLLWVPTRLLYVGGSEDPRLIETSPKGVQEPYAALSHMWGGPSQLPPLRTILSKYEDMLKAIPMWLLSKNFADAVIATRQLGLQYIWIDSLCIIQDSPADWQREAVMMHKVYRYAEVTIVAYVLLPNVRVF
jgi:hypothetical protein